MSFCPADRTATPFRRSCCPAASDLPASWWLKSLKQCLYLSSPKRPSGPLKPQVGCVSGFPHFFHCAFLRRTQEIQEVGEGGRPRASPQREGALSGAGQPHPFRWILVHPPVSPCPVLSLLPIHPSSFPQGFLPPQSRSSLGAQRECLSRFLSLTTTRAQSGRVELLQPEPCRSPHAGLLSLGSVLFEWAPQGRVAKQTGPFSCASLWAPIEM